MINPLFRAFNWFLAFLDTLPLPIRAFLFLSLMVFIFLAVFHVLWSLR